jgi:hypothetical protein
MRRMKIFGLVFVGITALVFATPKSYGVEVEEDYGGDMKCDKATQVCYEVYLNGKLVKNPKGILTIKP